MFAPTESLPSPATLTKTNFFVARLGNFFVKALKKGEQYELGRADLCKSLRE